jgi:hypothetical protein
MPECKNQHAECLHEMMSGSVLTVYVVEYDKEEDEEGYVNLVKGECPYKGGDGWRTPDDAWLELEAEEDVMHAYHVNIIMLS